jgi:hypothetical protein
MLEEAIVLAVVSRAASSSLHGTPGRIMLNAIRRASIMAANALRTSLDGFVVKYVRSLSAAYPLTRVSTRATCGPSRSSSVISGIEWGIALRGAAHVAITTLVVNGSQFSTSRMILEVKARVSAKPSATVAPK